MTLRSATSDQTVDFVYRDVLGQSSTDDFVYTSFAQIGPNKRLDYTPRMLDEQEWQRLYDGNFGNLMRAPTKTVENGTTFLAKVFPEAVNWFAWSTDFYVDALLTRRPGITGDERVAAYLREYGDYFWEQFEEAARFDGIMDRFIIRINLDSSYEAVNPSNVFIIYSPTNARLVQGYVFAYPYYEFINDVAPPPSGLLPNRVVLEYFAKDDENITLNERLICEYSEGQIGALISSEPGEIAEVLLIGDGKRSYYPSLSNLVRSLIIRETINSYILNVHGEPKEIRPPEAKPPQTDADGNILPSDDRAIVVSDPNGRQMYGFLEFSGNLTAADEKIARLHNEIHRVTGIPPSISGIDYGKGESGVAREHLLYAAQTRLASKRLKAEFLFNRFFRFVLNDVNIIVDVNWPEQPFASYEARVELAGEIKDAGGISLETYQTWLDLPVEDIEQGPTALEMMALQQQQTNVNQEI